MSLRIPTLILALCAAGSAAAGPNTVQRLAAETGLSERQVRMLAGPSSAFAEYRTSYRRLAERAARQGLSLRSQNTIERHARALDRPAELGMQETVRSATKS